jgi:murein DD-endopeptidase MepM/ murein hydrolase activator NlpD
MAVHSGTKRCAFTAVPQADEASAKTRACAPKRYVARRREGACAPLLQLHRSLLGAPEKFFARTRVNPDYGKPGWTRDCGKRFHRGCDIAPVNVTATGKTTRVVFTDCATGRDFDSEEPTFVPHDEVFCVFDGVVAGIVTDEAASDFGKHIIIEHVWPGSGEKFYTLYGHLAEICVGAASPPRLPKTGRGREAASTIGGEIRTPQPPTPNPQPLGLMGQTSRSADARNWMAIAPHLHFEVRDGTGGNYDPVEFLRRFGSKTERCS